MTTPLTKEQEAFLEECILEFSDRYTDADVEYKKVSESGIPPPPIVYPWNVRRRFPAGDRDHNRPGGSNRFRDYSHDDNYRDRSQYRENDRHRDNDRFNYSNRY